MKILLCGILSWLLMGALAQATPDCERVKQAVWELERVITVNIEHSWAGTLMNGLPHQQVVALRKDEQKLLARVVAITDYYQRMAAVVRAAGCGTPDRAPWMVFGPVK